MSKKIGKVYSRDIIINYLISDIKTLDYEDVLKLYKYVRRHLIANIEGLSDPLESNPCKTPDCSHCNGSGKRKAVILKE